MTIIHHKGMRYKLQNELFAHQGICRVLQIVSKLTVRDMSCFINC